MKRYRLVPLRHRQARAYVAEHHRHHRAPRGLIAAIGVADEAGLRGVAILGRPVARHYDDGWTVEVTRLCVDGAEHAASCLYGAARRLGFALGYERIITYTLPSESGSSLRAAGYRLVGERGGGRWSRKNRPRVDDHPTESKLLWDVAA